MYFARAQPGADPGVLRPAAARRLRPARGADVKLGTADFGRSSMIRAFIAAAAEEADVSRVPALLEAAPPATSCWRPKPRRP